MVIKYCISIQHRIFSLTSCFCVMSTFTLMIGSLKITTTFVTCVCLIGSVIQVVLDHLGSLVLHFIAPELPSPLPPTRKPQPAVWSSPDGPVQHRALRERSGSAHTSQVVWYLVKLSSRLCFLLDLLTNTLLQVYPQRVEERHRNNICLQDSFFVLFLLLVCSFCSPVHTCFIYLMLKKHIDKKYVCL